MAREEIGLGRCTASGCGARVLYKLDKQGRAYYRCTGGHDPDGRACGSAVLYFGPVVTERIKQEIGKVKNVEPAKRDDVEHKRKRADPAPTPKPDREPDPAKPAKRGGGGYDHLYE